jgi:adenine deaminase
MRVRRLVMPVFVDKHLYHTYQMLIASIFAAMVIVVLAGMLISTIL